jgi:hypothetical protein
MTKPTKEHPKTSNHFEEINQQQGKPNNGQRPTIGLLEQGEEPQGNVAQRMQINQIEPQPVARTENNEKKLTVKTRDREMMEDGQEQQIGETIEGKQMSEITTTPTEIPNQITIVDSPVEQEPWNLHQKQPFLNPTKT